MTKGFLSRWGWLAGLIVLLVAGAVYAFWPERQAVDIGTVTRGPMEVGVTDDGVTRASEYYVVSAPVTGYLSRIELEPGDTVQVGALIGRQTGSTSTPLDQRSRRSLAASLAASRAGEQAGETRLQQARRDLARAEELSQRGFLPKAQLEAAQTAVATGEADLEQARANSARIATELAEGSGRPSGQTIAIRAPASGEVMTVITESEGEVLQGTQIMTIGDPRRIEGVIDMLSRDAVKVKVGDPVRITGWGGEKPLPGRVTRIEPYGKLKVSALGIEEQRVNVIVDFAENEQAARIGHGYQIDATILVWRDPKALRVPIGAIFRGREGDWNVYVMDGGIARLRSVKLGRMNDQFAQVLGGLEEGDEVIIDPAAEIADGSAVRAR